eukprot:13945.XXX_515433_515606_1 [CDS] Oithona nana genome sequencing.
MAETTAAAVRLMEPMMELTHLMLLSTFLVLRFPNPDQVCLVLLLMVMTFFSLGLKPH